jgi:hypothetical protein
MLSTSHAFRERLDALKKASGLDEEAAIKAMKEMNLNEPELEANFHIRTVTTTYTGDADIYIDDSCITRTQILPFLGSIVIECYTFIVLVANLI